MNPVNKGTLVFVTDSDLDFRYGATNARMLCYSKAFSLKGITVIFTSACCSFLNNEKPALLEKDIYILGERENVKVHSRKALPVLKELNFISNLHYLRQLHLRFQDYEDLAYLLFPSNFSLSISTSIYLRTIKNRKVFIEKNELQLGIALNMPVPYGLKKIFYFPALLLQIILSGSTDITEIFFNGMICISTRLEKLYSNFYKKLIRIPILVDTKDIILERPEKADSGFFRICYFGTITEKKDGIFTLLKALSFLKNGNYNIICNLYGPVSESTNKKLKLLINKYQLEDVAKFHGNINNEEIKQMTVNQDLLILPRPLNLQTNFGFSTKLAEYLLSGVPVLTTQVSDISDYLLDGKNGFLIESNKLEILINKLEEIIKNGNNLTAIGEKGRDTAMKYFNYVNYSEKLHDFIFKNN